MKRGKGFPFIDIMKDENQPYYVVIIEVERGQGPGLFIAKAKIIHENGKYR